MKAKHKFAICFIFLDFVFKLMTYSQIENLSLHHYSSDENLSQAFINCIVQDSVGFMWFGTYDGLNKFDGTQFKIYNYSESDTTSLCGNVITQLASKDGVTIWIGTNNGLCNYNIYTDKFKRIRNVSDQNKSNFIQDMLIDSQNRIWFVLANNNYLFCYNPESENITKIYCPEKTEIFLNNSNNPNYFIKSIETASNNRILIGTNFGYLLIYNYKTNKFEHYIQLDTYYEVLFEYEDSDGSIWCSNGNCFYHIKKVGKPDELLLKYYYTYPTCCYEINNKYSFFGLQKGGFWIYDKINNEAIQYYLDFSYSNYSNPVGVTCIYKDKSGLFWFGSSGYGIYTLSYDYNNFQTINKSRIPIRKAIKYNQLTIQEIDNPASMTNIISFISARGIYADKDNIWVGGYFGLNKINRKTGEVQLIKNDIIPYQIVPDLFDKDLLWIADEVPVYSLKKYSISKNKVTNCEINFSNIYSICTSKNGLIWLGSVNKLTCYNHKTNSYKDYFSGNHRIQNCLPEGVVKSIAEDKAGNIWIASSLNGIAELNPATGKFVYYSHNNKNKNCLSNNSLIFISFDSKNNLLVGTNGSGFDIISPDMKTYRNFSVADGLPNNVIYSILEDQDHLYWVSSNHGITCYNPRSKNLFKTYDKSNGLQSNEFNTCSYFKSDNGELFFGGVNGFSYFNPKKLQLNEYEPPIVIANIEVMGEKFEFDKPEWQLSEITLPYDKNFFSIDFSVLSFFKFDQNDIVFNLEGNNLKLEYQRNNNKVIFNGLSPGKYILKIIAFNNDGYGSKIPKEIKINIVPPLFKRSWFVILILIIISFVIWRLYKMRYSRVKTRNVELENTIQKRTEIINNQKEEIERRNTELEFLNKELKQVNATKDKFFSIIAHDLKSPFTSILGFSDLLYSNYDMFSDNEKLMYLKQIKNASDNTYRLLQNLLEWSRFQLGAFDIKPTPFNLRNLIDENLQLLQNSALNKSVEIKTNIPIGIFAFADINIVNTVVRNLINNSIKFSRRGGIIEISASIVPDDEKHGQEIIEVSVKDSGIGIKADDVQKLFKIDEKFKREGTERELGTGIGLVICHDFIKKSGGKISVKSEYGSGSTFTFSLPRYLM